MKMNLRIRLGIDQGEGILHFDEAILITEHIIKFLLVAFFYGTGTKVTLAIIRPKFARAPQVNLKFNLQ